MQLVGAVTSLVIVNTPTPTTPKVNVRHSLNSNQLDISKISRKFQRHRSAELKGESPPARTKDMVIEYHIPGCTYTFTSTIYPTMHHPVTPPFQFSAANSGLPTGLGMLEKHMSLRNCYFARKYDFGNSRRRCGS